MTTYQRVESQHNVARVKTGWTLWYEDETFEDGAPGIDEDMEDS